jgi:hypothetical protein
VGQGRDGICDRDGIGSGTGTGWDPRWDGCGTGRDIIGQGGAEFLRIAGIVMSSRANYNFVQVEQL